MNEGLKGKKILVTAGPTWVPIDKVRVITNIFGGSLGVIIAEKFVAAGAKVTLLMGRGRAVLPSESDNLKIIKFTFFDDLLRLVNNELKNNNYDAMIHSAAVADYTPVTSESGKIKSGKQELIIKLKPTIKIVDLVKEIAPKIFLVKFKLEVGVTKEKLIDIAKTSMIESDADLMIANEFSETGKNHRAYFIDKEQKVTECQGKENIAEEIVGKVSKSFQ